MTIRPSLEVDIPVLTAIYGHHVLHGTASFEINPPDETEMIRRRAELLRQGMPHLVLEADGMVRGYAYAGPYRPRAAYKDTVEDSIYLAADAAGFGYGHALLRVLIDACTALNFRQMIAVVGDSGNLPSIRLHERHGFCRVGTLQSIGFKHGRWLDVVLLQRSLGNGDTALPHARAQLE